MDKSIPFFDLSESEQQHINVNIDENIPYIVGTRRQAEVDVLGSMLLNGSVKTGVLRDLQPRDMSNKNFGVIYQEMLNAKDRTHKFDAMSLLNDNIAHNKYLLNLMNECIDSNIDIKCDWLVNKAIKVAI